VAATSITYRPAQVLPKAQPPESPTGGISRGLGPAVLADQASNLTCGGSGRPRLSRRALEGWRSRRSSTGHSLSRPRRGWPGGSGSGSGGEGDRVAAVVVVDSTRVGPAGSSAAAGGRKWASLDECTEPYSDVMGWGPACDTVQAVWAFERPVLYGKLACQSCDVAKLCLYHRTVGLRNLFSHFMKKKKKS
jgi:hypothetical protein